MLKGENFMTYYRLVIMGVILGKAENKLLPAFLRKTSYYTLAYFGKKNKVEGRFVPTGHTVCK